MTTVLEQPSGMPTAISVPTKAPMPIGLNPFHPNTQHHRRGHHDDMQQTFVSQVALIVKKTDGSKACDQRQHALIVATSADEEEDGTKEYQGGSHGVEHEPKGRPAR